MKEERYCNRLTRFAPLPGNHVPCLRPTAEGVHRRRNFGGIEWIIRGRHSLQSLFTPIQHSFPTTSNADTPTDLILAT